MSTRTELNIDGFFDNVITSYETRIQQIQTAFQSSENLSESSHSLLDNIHNSLNNLRRERELLNLKLCETLAKKGSLRKKDYHAMMSDILSILDEKEKKAEKEFLIFIETQKEVAKKLKNSLLSMKDITNQDAHKKITNIKQQLAQISKQQEIKKEAVMKTFVDFQNMHNRMIECLETLLEKSDHILLREIKRVKDYILDNTLS